MRLKLTPEPTRHRSQALKMAYDVRIHPNIFTNSNECPNYDKTDGSHSNEKLVFITIKTKDTVSGEELQNCVLNEIVRLHGNRVLCSNDKFDGIETHTRSLNLPFPESSVKKVVVGNEYIGLLFNDGRVCRIQHRIKLQKAREGRLLETPVASTSRSKDPGNGTGLQIASDEIFARNLQSNMDRQGRSSSRSVFSNMVFPSTSHDPRLSRLSRRYEQYTMLNRGRRVSLLPNLVEVEERVGPEIPYRSNSTNVVLGPRASHVVQLQRVSSNTDIPIDNLTRHIPVIIGQTLRLPERMYSEPIRLPQQSLEDALNARRGQGTAINSLGDYESSELNDYILPDVQQMSPLIDSHNFEEDSVMSRPSLSTLMSGSGGQRSGVERNEGLPTYNPDLIQFVENPSIGSGLSPPVVNSEGENSNDNFSTANLQNSFSPTLQRFSSASSSLTQSVPGNLISGDDLASDVSQGKGKSINYIKTLSQNASNKKGNTTSDILQQEASKADGKTSPIDTVFPPECREFITSNSGSRKETIQAPPSQFHMDSILAPVIKPAKDPIGDDSSPSNIHRGISPELLGLRASSALQSKLNDSSSSTTILPSIMTAHKPEAEFMKAELPSQSCSMPKSSSVLSFSNVEYPPGFRPMSGKLGFMTKKGQEATSSFAPGGQSTQKQEEDSRKEIKDGWPDTGSIEWLEDGIRYSDIVALHSEFLLVTQNGKNLKSWGIHKYMDKKFNMHHNANAENMTDLVNHLGLKGEQIKSISSSVLRATIQTESGKFATFYDRSLRESHNDGMPSLIKELSHPCQVFDALKAEEVVDLQCSLFSTTALARSGKVYWWGLPPHNERQMLDKRKMASNCSNQEIKIGDTVGLKRQSNEVGSLVLKISDPLFPCLGIIKSVSGDSTTGSSESSRRYLVEVVGKDGLCQKRAQNYKTTSVQENASVANAMITTEDDEIQLINFCGEKPEVPNPSNEGITSESRKQESSSMDKTEKASCDANETLLENSMEQVWASTDILFLEESASVLGQVVAIDGQFVVVSPVHTPDLKDSNRPPNLSSKAYKVYFLSTVEKITSDLYSSSSRFQCSTTRYSNILEPSPKPLFDSHDKPCKHQALCMDSSEAGVSILVKRLKDDQVFLLHPQSVKEDNSKVFTCSNSSATTLESLNSEANVTQEVESVKADTSNLDCLVKSTRTYNLHGKRKAEDASTFCENSRRSCQSDDLKPKLRTLGLPFTTFLLDNLGCPYPIKFLTGLKDPPQLECGPLSDFRIIEYPSDERYNEKVITIVTALKPLQLIPLIIFGNKEEFTQKVKAIEKEVKRQKASGSTIKRPRMSMSDSANGENDTGGETGRPLLMVDEMEARDDIHGRKGSIEWLDERSSGNQNLLHICAANISSRNHKASEKQYFDIFHDEVFMLNSLLESTSLWPWISELLAQRDANGCTPFMTALMCKNHHAAYYILKALRRHDLSNTGKSYLESVLCTPSFSGITPIHQLIMNANRKHATSSVNNALKITNIPTSYTPRMLLKLFKSRYASVYRACIPSIKSRWKPLTVRTKVKAMHPSTENDEDNSKSAAHTLTTPSSLHPANPTGGGYIVGTRLAFGGERAQRANAFRASAKEGMVQFGNLDELRQALSEMHGYGVISETDHPSGVLTSVVQHVLNVQLFDDHPQESGSRSVGGHVRRFLPISQNEAANVNSPLSQVQRNPAPQPLQSSRATLTNTLQEQPPLSKNREENIAKCFDDFVGYMVLGRLLLVFPEIGAMTSSTQETALSTFFKHLSRCYPSPLSKHFLLWRPCKSKKCCYKKFCNGLDITPAAGSKIKGKPRRQSNTKVKRSSSFEECRSSDDSIPNFCNSVSKVSSLSAQISTEDGGSNPSLIRTISTQSTDSQGPSASMSEYVIASEICPDVLGEPRVASKQTPSGDYIRFSGSPDFDESEPQSSGYSFASSKSDDSDVNSKARDNKTDYLDTSKDTFMAPSPSIMKCKVLENVDLDQLDDRTDNLSNCGDQPDSSLPPNEGEQQVLGGLLRSSFSPQVPLNERVPFRHFRLPNGGTAMAVDCSSLGDESNPSNPNIQRSSLFGESSNPSQTDVRTGSTVFSGDKWIWVPSPSTNVESKNTQTNAFEQGVTTAPDVSTGASKPVSSDCVCQQTSQKLPLFDRFQAPVFQLAKNWPCIVASILGFYDCGDTDMDTKDEESGDEGCAVSDHDHEPENQNEGFQSFLPSAKLDVFTEALLSSPFDILLEFMVKTLQAKLEESISLQSFECFKACIESKLSSPASVHLMDCNKPLYVAQRFVRSVVRHMSLFLGKHSPMEISLRYKIRKRGKSSSKKEERLLLGLNVCLKAFSWLSVIELLRAATATIEPVLTGTVKAQPKAIVSGLMGNGAGQMQQNILFRPNIRIHGPQSQSSSTSSVIGRMATRIDATDAQSGGLCGTQFTNTSSLHQPTVKSSSKIDNNPYSSKLESESDSDEDNQEPMVFRSTPTQRVNRSRTLVPEPMVIVEEEEDAPADTWTSGVRIRPESPSAWALNGHVTSANELSNRVVNRLFGSQPQENKGNLLSLHHGNCYLTRIFSRLVKEAVDLVKDLTETKETKQSDGTKPFEVDHLKFPDELEKELKNYAMGILDVTWSWLSTILNNLEQQLQLGQKYDTGHYVTRLQVPENELEYHGFGRPTQSYTYISQPEEYLLYLIKAKMGEERESLPVLDLLSYSHLTFVLDAFIYSKKHWPREKDFAKKNDRKRPFSGTQSFGSSPFSLDLKLSEENARFLGEHMGRCSNAELLNIAESITGIAKNPHTWLKMPTTNGQDSSKDVQKPLVLSSVLGYQETKDKMNENEEVKKIHTKWKLTISSFCKLFLTEPPGYERESFLALEAGAAGRISSTPSPWEITVKLESVNPENNSLDKRFQRSVSTLRTAFKSDNGYYPVGVSQESSSVNPLLSINVKRSDLMEDCLKVFLDQMDNHPYGSLRVRFEGEEGAGPGVNRGLFASFARCLKSGQKILNWPVGLLYSPGVSPEQSHIFAPVSGKRYCVQGNEPFQGKMTSFRRRMVFVAIGRFLGLTLWFNQAIPLIFTRSVLKYLLHREEEICFEDLAFHNASMFSALSHMLVDSRNSDMTPQKFADIYFLRFEANVDNTVEELIPGGSDINVVPANVIDYIRLYTKHILITSIENEMEGMREGLQQIIPRELLDSLTPEDLQLLLSGGVESVDYSRLKSIITFSNSRRCQKELFEKYKGWFWRIVRKMTPYQRQQLLHFATGSSVLPALDNRVGNNEELAITVDVIDGNTNALPMASTCGQRISLPLYPSKKTLKGKLLQAIECQAYGLG